MRRSLHLSMHRIFCVLLAGLLMASASAETPAGGMTTLTLHETLRRSLRNHPDIARLGEGLADKLATAIEIEVKLNPSIALSRGVVLAPGDRGNTYSFEMEQPLRPSDFGLRDLYAGALRVTANLEQQVDVIRILSDTAVNYYRLWALQEREAILEDARIQAGLVVESLQQQLAAGQGNVSQQSIFQAEAARFGAELLAVRGERAGAQAELQRATGLAFRELRLAQPGFTPVPSTFALTRFADSRSGVRRIILARRAAASRGLDVAMADRFPEFGPGIMYSYNSMDKEAEFAFTISARLPLWDQNQGPITRARGALDAANRELAAYDRVSLDRIIEGRRQQVLNLEARANAFRNEVIPAYHAAYDASLAQFRAGQATTLQLYEVQRSRIESQEKALDYAVEALSARSQLEQLIGGKLEEVSGDASFRVRETVTTPTTARRVPTRRVVPETRKK